MGLAGRKVKQRIPNDPRNLSWADDANKFGAAYLAKLGWSSGTGLGVSGEGRTTHIKVHQKLDMLGIGAAHQKDPNGLAWKQNRDFENLLRRLNASSGEDVEESVTKVDGFAKAREETGITSSEGKEEEVSEKKRKRADEEAEGKSKKKRKDNEVEGSGELEEKKKDKKEKKEKKDKKKKGKKDKSETKEGDEVVEVAPAASPATQKPPFSGRPVRAHRARFLASKCMAATSSAAVDEILGISRSGTSTPYPTTIAADSSSSSPTPVLEDADVKLQELKTSSKSVMDYFKEKLLAKSNANSGSTTAVASPSATPSREVEDDDDWSDRPRGGLGLGFARGGIGSSSQLRSELTVDGEIEETGRAGLGSFSRVSFHAGFTSATASSSKGVVQEESVEVEVREEMSEEKLGEVKREKGGKKEKSERKRKNKNRGKEREDIESLQDKKPERSKEDKKGKRKASEAEAGDEKGADAPVATVETAEAETGGQKKRKKEKKRKATSEESSSAQEETAEPRKKKRSKREKTKDAVV